MKALTLAALLCHVLLAEAGAAGRPTRAASASGRSARRPAVLRPPVSIDADLAPIVLPAASDVDDAAPASARAARESLAPAEIEESGWDWPPSGQEAGEDDPERDAEPDDDPALERSAAKARVLFEHALASDKTPLLRPFAPAHAALDAMTPHLLDALVDRFRDWEEAKWKPSYDRLPIGRRLAAADALAKERLRWFFRTPAAYHEALRIERGARTVKMMEGDGSVRDEIMESGRLKSSAEKGVIPGRFHHERPVQNQVLSDILGAPLQRVRKAFEPRHYPRYGFIYYDSIPRRFLNAGTSERGLPGYGNDMWIFRNDPAALSLMTVTGADSGSFPDLAAPMSPAFLDIRLWMKLMPRIGLSEDGRRASVPRPATVRQVRELYRALATGNRLENSEGQMYSGSLEHLEAVAIPSWDLASNPVPNGFVEWLRARGVKFYEILYRSGDRYDREPRWTLRERTRDIKGSR